MENNYYEDVKKLPIMVALIIASFFAFLGETLLNVALPRFMANFNITADTASWLITGYLLVIGVFVPAAAYLIRKFRTRVLFLSALMFFLVGNTVCAVALNFPMLLAGRFVQAIGTAILIPLNLNVILALNPPEKRGTANGIFILVMMFAPSIGPTLSGIIVEHFSWRALFWMVIPFTVLSVIMGIIFMRDVTKTSNPKFDIVSMIFSTAGFGSTIYGLSIAGHMSLKALIFLSVGVLSLIIFVIRQFKIPNPMLDLRVFKYSNFRISVIFIAVSMIALFSDIMLMPIFLQKVLGISAFATGLAMMPYGLVDGLMSPVSGKIYDKFGGRYLVIIGFIFMGGTLFYFSFLNTGSDFHMIVFVLCLLGAGVPLVMTSAQTSGLNSLPPKYYPHGTAVLNTVQQISASIGSSFFVMLMTTEERQYALLNGISGLPTPESLAYGIRWSYTVSALLVVLPFIMSIYLLARKHRI